MMREHHTFVEPGARRGLLDRLVLSLAAFLFVTLLFVWAAGELAGGIWRGSWPDVPCVQSAAELARLVEHPGDPVATGVPGGAGYFTVLSLLVVAAAAVVIWTWRLLHRPRVYWAPPRLLGRGADRAFIRAYRSGRAGRRR